MRTQQQLVDASEHLHYEVWMLRLTSFHLRQFAESQVAGQDTALTAYTHTTHVTVSVYSSDAPVTPPSASEDEAAQINALLESFAIHLRVLLDFFYQAPDKAQPDDVLAEHYFHDPGQWRDLRPQLDQDQIASIKRRVGKEVAHLSYKRILLSDVDKLWPFLELKSYALHALSVFLRNVNPAFLSQRWKEQSA